MTQRDILKCTATELAAGYSLAWIQRAMRALRRNDTKSARRQIVFAARLTRKIVQMERENHPS